MVSSIALANMKNEDVLREETLYKSRIHTISERVVTFKLPQSASHSSRFLFLDNSLGRRRRHLLRGLYRWPKWKFRQGILSINRDYLRGVQGDVKLMEICFCTLSILLCAGARGIGGERGFAIVASSVGLLSALSILAIKYRTLNRYSTPRHWFIMESFIYGLLALILWMASLALLLTGPLLKAVDQERADLHLFGSLSLAATACLFTVDLMLVCRERNSRTWIPFISKYRI